MAEFEIHYPAYCCDIALRKVFVGDHFDPDKVTRVVGPEQEYLTRFVGKIASSGTCFTLCKARGRIMIRYYCRNVVL
jgi:hypothetical protein